jgi:hypothetical protein
MLFTPLSSIRFRSARGKIHATETSRLTGILGNAAARRQSFGGGHLSATRKRRRRPSTRPGARQVEWQNSNGDFRRELVRGVAGRPAEAARELAAARRI